MPQNKRFTEKEIKFLKENYKKMSIEELAKELGRTEKSVRAKVERIGLKLSDLKRNQPKKLTEKEVNFIKENYQSMSDEKIARELNISEAMVSRKRLNLGLRKQPKTPYINGEYLQTFENGKRVWIHKKEAENKIGRKLKKTENVHHVDGDKLNNKHENLYVCKDRSEHSKIHSNLEKVAFEMVKKGLIKFDHEKGQYYL